MVQVLVIGEIRKAGSGLELSRRLESGVTLLQPEGETESSGLLSAGREL